MKLNVTQRRTLSALNAPSTSASAKSSFLGTNFAPAMTTRTRQAVSVAVRARSAAIVRAQLRNIDMPEALLFDCDGVLVDTERDGHRISFNEAFTRKGLKHEWDVDLYGHLLEIGGGKERMNKYFLDHEDVEPYKSIKGAEERKKFLQELHYLKTDLFMELIETGRLPLRPGVKALIEEAMDAGVKVAVCSTSNERAVSKIVEVMLGPKIFNHMRVFAGDIVPKKKPSPDIYNLAAKELNVNPARCVVIEDSRIGLLAGKAAGMRVVVTKSSYTKNENFDVADAVFDQIEGNFTLNDLTTPGSFWLNPPLPMDANGNWYRGEEAQTSVASTSSQEDARIDAVLADIDPAPRRAKKDQS